MLDHLWLRVRIALIGSAGMRYHGGIELLAKFASQFSDSPLCIFRKHLRRGAILDSIHSLARVVFEIAQDAFQLLLHLADLGLLLFFALGSQL